MKKLLSALALLFLLPVAALATHTPATYSIGSGGDYATIAAFLTAHPHGTGHTLTILAGTVTGQTVSTYLPHNTTINGATSDESLYIIKPPTINGYCVSTDSTLVVNNVTFQSIASFGSNAVECEGNGAGTANTGDVTLRNVHFDDFNTAASQIIHGNDFLRRRYIDCYFAHCDAGTDGAIDNNPFEPGSDIIVDGCVFYHNISTGYPIFYWSITDTLCTAADSIVVKNSLLVDNRKSSVYVNANFAADVDATQRPGLTVISDHNTFVGNESPGGTAANKGQLLIGNVDGFATTLVSNCIFAFSDTTYAVQSTALDSVVHTAVYGCAGSNALDGLAFADTLLGPDHNPHFMGQHYDYPTSYIATTEETNHCVGGGYMGWRYWTGPFWNTTQTTFLDPRRR